jgi:Rho guanine nucleotide exchange factor 7
MSPPPHLGTSQPTRSNSSSMQQISQHKRSLSFNHHLSYNQVQAQQQQSMHQHPQHQAFMKPNLTPQHQLLSQRKEIVPISPSIKSAQVKSKRNR